MDRTIPVCHWNGNPPVLQLLGPIWFQVELNLRHVSRQFMSRLFWKFAERRSAMRRDIVRARRQLGCGRCRRGACHHPGERAWARKLQGPAHGPARFIPSFLSLLVSDLLSPGPKTVDFTIRCRLCQSRRPTLNARHRSVSRAVVSETSEQSTYGLLLRQLAKRRLQRISHDFWQRLARDTCQPRRDRKLGKGVRLVIVPRLAGE